MAIPAPAAEEDTDPDDRGALKRNPMSGPFRDGGWRVSVWRCPVSGGVFGNVHPTSDPVSPPVKDTEVTLLADRPDEMQTASPRAGRALERFMAPLRPG